MNHPLRRDSKLVGLLVGLIGPIVLFALLSLINDSFADPFARDGFRGFTLKGKLILSILPNVAFFEVYKRRKLNESLTGVVGATIICGVIMAILIFTVDQA